MNKDTLRVFALLLTLVVRYRQNIAIVEQFNREHPEHDAQDCESDRVGLAEATRWLERLTTEHVDLEELRQWLVQKQIESKKHIDRINRRKGLRGLIEVEDALTPRSDPPA